MYYTRLMDVVLLPLPKVRAVAWHLPTLRFGGRAQRTRTAVRCNR